MQASIQISRRDTERFWSKVRKGTSEQCWLWTGGLSATFGVGKFRLNGRKQTAARVVWAMFNGVIPDAMCVLHRCDNPACVNPGHLFLGTKQDNMADKKAKGRCPKGVEQPGSKLTEFCVKMMRELRFKKGATVRSIAKQFGVSAGLACLVINGKRWKHVT